MAIVLALTALLAAADGQSDRYAGRSLAHALQLLQQQGLPIVYSSVVVTDAMRVATEPRASEPRSVLEELLRPHGLEAKRGPGGVLQIVRATKAPSRRSREIATSSQAAEASAASAPIVYDERVVVRAPIEERATREAVAQSVLSGADIRTRTSVLANDVLTAFHALPRVAATSDFRNDFAVRGSGSRHIAVVIDDIAAPMLRHAVYGIGESATLTMINPDVVDRAALQIGAYPRRLADPLGGQVSIAIREGSRTRTAFRGSIGGVAAAVVAEGPIRLAATSQGPAAGSWLFSLRHSFLDWPTTSFAAEYGGTGFGFRDVQAKAVYDLSESQRVSLTVVAGHALADNGDAVGPGGFFQGRHDAALVTAGWRSSLTEGIVLQQRAYFLSDSIHNTDPSGATLLRAHERGIGYRADLTRTWRAFTIEGGGQFQQRAARAGYVNTRWAVTPSLTLSQGARIAGSTWTSRIATSPWMTAEWKMRGGWTVAGAVGAGHQFSENRAAPERARYVDVSLERSVASRMLVQATLFDRAERDVIDPLFSWATLAGSARGVELAMQLLPTGRFNGSVAYSYGRARYHDNLREAFWGDFDQRHAVNAFASYTLTRATISAAFRTGTNFPIAGYFADRDGMLVVGDRRNAVRRPGYSRFDLQASRAFQIGGREMTLVGELLNVLNRTNFAAANGFIRADGEAVGFSEKLLPRFATVGLRIAF